MDLFNALSKDPAVDAILFIAFLVSGVVKIYEKIWDEAIRARHQQVLLSAISNTRNYDLSLLVPRAAQIVGSILDHIFGKAEDYNLKDKKLWRSQVFIITILFNLLLVAIFAINWSSNYDEWFVYLFGPLALGSITAYSGLDLWKESIELRTEKEKTINKILFNRKGNRRKKIKVKKKDQAVLEQEIGVDGFKGFTNIVIGLIVIYSAIGGLFYLGSLFYQPMEVVAQFFWYRGRMAASFAYVSFVTAISLGITRWLLFKISENKTLHRAIVYGCWDIILALSLSLLSYIVTSGFIFRLGYYIELLSSGGATGYENINYDGYFYLIFFLSLIPTAFFLVIVLCQYFVYIFAIPLKYIVTVIFTFFIKYNLHTYLLACSFIVLCLHLYYN